MAQQFQDNRFDVMGIAMEVANDVVAFDSHLVLLEVDRRRRVGRVIWQYEFGPCYAGKEYERWISIIAEFQKGFESEKSARTVGFVKKKLRGYIVEMRYKSKLKGILLVLRSAEEKFSTADVRLLKCVGDIAAAAMCEPQAFALLRRLHLHFLDRRTSAFQAEDVKLVLKQYLEKIEYVLHPELFSEKGEVPYPIVKVRSAAKLITENGTALYIAACRTTTNRGELHTKEWSQKKLATRYDADGKSSITAWVFAKQRHLMTNKYDLLQTGVKRLFHDVRSHISAPIVAGSERCHGVLSVETGGEVKYTPIQCDVMVLLAGHVARPLGWARDREVAAGRLADLAVIRDMTHSLQECNSWRKVQSVLCDGLPKMRYRRGIICEVLYDKKLVIGSQYWGANMREVCRTTRRYFVRNKTDCQIKAVMEKMPQVVSDPREDPAAHPEAVRRGALRPFAIIPGVDSDGMVRWTLHVEREDTAPIGVPEIAHLQEICRAATAAREHLETAHRQREMTDVAIAWAQRLQMRFSRDREVLQSLADFAVEHVCSRCRVYHLEGKELVGVCYAGRRLGRIKNFTGFRVPPSVPKLETIFRREPRPIIVRLSTPKRGGGLKREFRVEYVRSMSHRTKLEKEGVYELIELPVFVQGNLANVVVFDKKGVGFGKEDHAFRTDEVRLLGTLGKLTALALERTNLAQEVSVQAAVGASMGIFRHEIAGCVSRLSDAATLYRRATRPTERDIRNVLDTIKRETNRMEQLREFFTKEVLREKTKGVKHTTVKHEIDSAIDLLGLTGSDLIKHPKENIKVKVSRKQRPLCLVLLQLLSNAIKAIGDGEEGAIKISFNQGRGQRPHVLSVIDGGAGISEAMAQVLRKNWFTTSGPDSGLGLRCAKLVAQGEGWTLRLARRKNPTRFELLIPPY